MMRAETCKLIGLFIPSQINTIIPKQDVGIHREDGLEVVKKKPRTNESIKKKLLKKF